MNVTLEIKVRLRVVDLKYRTLNLVVYYELLQGRHNEKDMDNNSATCHVCESANGYLRSRYSART